MDEEPEQFECSECGADVKEDDKACPQCGTDFEQIITPTKVAPDSIGGWLILVAIGLVISPLRSLFLLFVGFKYLAPVFEHDTWSVLTTPGTEAYHPMWAPLLIFELAGNIIFIVLSIVIAVLFFQKKAIAPKMIIGFLVSNFFFLLIDYVVADTIPFVAQQGNPDATKELIRSFVECAIWVPYFFVSQRVKSTFLR